VLSELLANTLCNNCYKILITSRGNRPSSGAEGTHVSEILQSPRTEDEAKIAGGYT